MLLGGFFYCDDFAILEESCYVWRPYFDALVLGGDLGGFVYGTLHLEVSLVMHLEAWEVFALVVLEIDDGRGLMIGDY